MEAYEKRCPSLHIYVYHNSSAAESFLLKPLIISGFKEKWLNYFSSYLDG
jgi:hypothetical protein